MLLVIDTSTAACAAALLDDAGACVASATEVIGRGHAERLVPMIEEMLAGRKARSILVGVGPGSFTGIRVGLAAAHGLAIGWGAEVRGASSLALLAAGADGTGNIAAAIDGGHGELFVQEFDSATLNAKSALYILTPPEAARTIGAETVVGPGSAKLVEARGFGSAAEQWPAVDKVLRLPEALRTLPASPIYGRAPDAKAKAA